MMIKSEPLRRRLSVPDGPVVDAHAPRRGPAAPRPLLDDERAYEDAVSEGWPDRSSAAAPAVNRGIEEPNSPLKILEKKLANLQDESLERVRLTQLLHRGEKRGGV